MTRQMSEDDYDPVVVDENNLDVEWQAQAWLMRQASLKVVTAKRLLSDAKTRLEVWESETRLRIRSRPEQYGITKVVNEVVADTLIVQPEYARRKREIAQLQEQLETFETLVVALHHRKAALENLVILDGRDHYSTPRVSGEANDKARRKMRERVNSGRGLYPQKGMQPRDHYDD